MSLLKSWINILSVKSKAVKAKQAFTAFCFSQRNIIYFTAHTKYGDSMINSIWSDYSDMPKFSSLEKDTKVDVLIVGGGLSGILCAYKLAQAGIEYMLIEADKIMNGVSRNTTAKITSQHGLIYSRLINEFDTDTARLYYKANEQAVKEYYSFAENIDCDFEEKINYIYSVDSPESLEKELAALQKIGAVANFYEKTDLPFKSVGAVGFEKQAQFHPIKFISKIAKGLNIYEKTSAKEFIGKTVITDKAKITAEKIIMATHFPIINKHGGYFLKMYQQRSYVTAIENTADIGGMYLDEKENGLSFRKYGKYLLLGGGGHRTGKQGGGWRELDRAVQKYYPDGRVKYRFATQDCMTLDGIAYIGNYSKSTPDMYVATGFNKWGMTQSLLSADILCDLILGRSNPYAEIFSPSRTVIRPQLFINIAESAMNIAKFKKPRCTHLGCALEWNSMERSWDCSCHGSRFTKEGKILDNPATKDLK